jgi:hypothetical protein
VIYLFLESRLQLFFALFILAIGSCFVFFFPGQPGLQTYYFRPPTAAGTTGACTMPSFSSLRWCLTNFLALDGLESQSSSPQPPSGMGWQVQATVPSYWLKLGLSNFLPRLVSNWYPPNLSVPNSDTEFLRKRLLDNYVDKSSEAQIFKK